MDHNQKQLTFGLQWQMRDRVDGQDQAVFSWQEGIDSEDDDTLSKVLSSLTEQGLLAKIEQQSEKWILSSSTLVHLLTTLAQVNPALFHQASTGSQSQMLQMAFRALELAKGIVRNKDVFAAAFVSSFSVEKSLNVLRETASVTDDVMPSWGSGNGQFSAFWVPAWSIPELSSFRLSLIAQTNEMMQAKLAVDDMMDWLVILFVNELVRLTIFDVTDTSLSHSQSYRVMYRGEADVFEAWRAALSSENNTFTADGWLVAKSMRQALQKSGWLKSNLDDYSGRNTYELTFQLVPPGQDAPAADWYLVYTVRHKFFRWSKPLSAWWEQSERVWRLGQDTLVEPDTWMLARLREAGRVCAPIEKSLEQPNPVYCAISADDVYTFLTESAVKLRELGFQIEAPDVVHENGSRVRVRVRVKRPKSDNKHQSSTGPQWFDANRLVDFDWSIVIDDEEISRDEFSKLVESQTPFIQVNGSWRLVPVDEILRQLDQFGAGKQLSARVMDLSRAILMSSSTSEIPVQVEYQEEALPIEEVIQVLTNASNPPIIETPQTFRGSLRHYQQFGYSWLLHLRSIRCGACLADDMGLGKTVQVLAYLLNLQEQQEVQGVHLLVCPTSLLPNWRAELTRFAPNLKLYVHHGSQRDLEGYIRDHGPVDLVMTTYSTLVRDVELFESMTFDALIVDEAQNIKNADTKQAQAIRQVEAHHRIALTGTPMENRLEELWALMDFLNPGYIGSVSWFRKTLAEPTLKNPGGEASTKLQVLLQPVLLRRRKSDPEIQTELPDKWEVNEHAYLTNEQAAVYQALVDQLFTDIRPLQGGGMSRRGQILATLVRLKQVCDHPCLVSGGTPSVRRSGKLRQLIELLQTVVAEGEGALVFTQFRDMGEVLCDTIEAELSVRPKFLHGGLSASVRGQIVEEFQRGEDPSPILVLSLRAGGVGLNLTRANHVFHFDRWWNPAVEDQATDRAYRIGQTKDVQVHKMICTGTLEERIDDLITSKRELSQAIVGGSNEWVTELDDNALRALFTLGDQSVLEEDEA